MDRVERWRALCDERIRLAALSSARFKRGEPTGAIHQRIAEIAAELEALNVTPKERAGGLPGRAARSQMEYRRVDPVEPVEPLEPLDGWAALRAMERKFAGP